MIIVLYKTIIKHPASSRRGLGAFPPALRSRRAPPLAPGRFRLYKGPMRLKLRRTIGRDLFLVALLGLAFPVVQATVLYSRTMRSLIEDRVAASRRVVAAQAADRLRSVFEGTDLILRIVVTKVVESPFYGSLGDRDGVARIEAHKGMIDQLRALALSNPALDGIYVVDGAGRVVGSPASVDRDALLDQPWLRDFVGGEERESFSAVHEAVYDSGLRRAGYPRVVSVCRRVTNLASKAREAVVVVDVLADPLERELERAGEGGDLALALYAGSGTEGAEGGPGAEAILWANAAHRGASARALETAQSLSIVPGALRLEAAGLEGAVESLFRETVAESLALSGVLVLLGLLAAFLFERSITRPLSQLYKAMASVGSGDFDPGYPDSRYEEVAFLVDRFRTMVGEIDELMAAKVRKENEAVAAELRSLEARIHPHFLYNTLDVMRGMATAAGDRDVADMAFSLSRMFRYSIKETDELVPLAREFANAADYVRIQTFRFADRVRYAADCPEEAAGRLVPKLVLQPLVENAYKHGLEGVPGGGSVRATARTDGADVVLEVEDDGRGFDAAALDRLSRALAEEPTAGAIAASGGIAGVHFRVRLAFGPGYGVAVGRRAGGGAVVSVRMPGREAP